VYEYLKTRTELQEASVYSRLVIAILISIGIHFFLLTWVMQQTRPRHPDDHGLLQVMLPRYSVDQSGPNLVKSDDNFSFSKIKKSKHETKGTETDKPPKVAADAGVVFGHFHWQTAPDNQRYQFMNAMQQIQFAHQRELQVNGVLAGLSNLADQLRPVLSGRIVCSQVFDNEIDCNPAPNEQQRPLLTQFFSIALEAHRLGISVNPIHMDFGPDQSVSVTLLQ
jgi:hypothetical protein